MKLSTFRGEVWTNVHPYILSEMVKVNDAIVDGNNDGNNASNDGNAALTAEECQPVRQLGVLELVVAGRTDHTS